MSDDKQSMQERNRRSSSGERQMGREDGFWLGLLAAVLAQVTAKIVYALLVSVAAAIFGIVVLCLAEDDSAPRCESVLGTIHIHFQNEAHRGRVELLAGALSEKGYMIASNLDCCPEGPNNTDVRYGPGRKERGNAWCLVQVLDSLDIEARLKPEPVEGLPPGNYELWLGRQGIR